LLLREAIAYAHILGLHQDLFYADLDTETSQYYLRIAWILFITDRSVPPLTCSSQGRVADADPELTLCSKTYLQHSSSAQHSQSFNRNMTQVLAQPFVAYANFSRPSTTPVLQTSGRSRLAFSGL
jgi:hypothetical protein